MADEKVPLTQIVGKNGTYTITGTCYTINSPYGQVPWIYEGVSDKSESSNIPNKF